MKTVHVQYFAILREQRGVAAEKLATEAATPGALYDELRARHGFSLPRAGPGSGRALNVMKFAPGGARFCGRAIGWPFSRRWREADA